MSVSLEENMRLICYDDGVAEFVEYANELLRPYELELSIAGFDSADTVLILRKCND